MASGARGRLLLLLLTVDVHGASVVNDWVLPISSCLPGDGVCVARGGNRGYTVNGNRILIPHHVKGQTIAGQGDAIGVPAYLDPFTHTVVGDHAGALLN